eukprot:8320522-Lingulodinium_polyedra.AAC.1
MRVRARVLEVCARTWRVYVSCKSRRPPPRLLLAVASPGLKAQRGVQAFPFRRARVRKGAGVRVSPCGRSEAGRGAGAGR